MTACCAIIHCWAAMAAFRASVPPRLRDETGWAPSDAGIAEQIWRPSCRIAGAVLLGTAFAISVYRNGAFEGVLLAGAAAMFASITVTLFAPIARRVVWRLAMVAMVASPVVLAVTLVWGGGHGG